MQKYDEALKLAQEELHTSEEKLVYNTLGVIYVLKGEEDKAIESFNKAIEADLEFDSAMLNLAVLYSIKGDRDKAIRAYKRALPFRPQDTEVLTGIGVNLMKEGEYEEGFKYLQQAAEIDPKDSTNWFNLAVAYMSIKIS